jgi:quercetin dioxygenase-like cupin family protein/predicted RNase H-like HicB family nuclease
LGVDAVGCSPPHGNSLKSSEFAIHLLATAQDANLAKPNLLKKQIVEGMPKGEKQEVSALTATFKPGDKTLFHTHRFPVTVYVTAGAFTLELEGQPEVTVRAGEAYVEPRPKHSVSRPYSPRRGQLERGQEQTCCTKRLVVVALPVSGPLALGGRQEGQMYRVWYWAMIDRESDGRFIASIPDLGDLAAYGDTDKDAVAHVTDLASERVRAAVEDGQPVPQRRQFSEMPSHVRSKEVGRAIIPVEVERRAAWPTPPYHMPA